jgi:hypothetical protein
MATSQRAAGRQLGSITLPKATEQIVAVTAIGLAIVVIARALPTYPALTQFRGESLRALPDVLAPLVVLALFIERAVEVVLAGWRAGETIRLSRDLEQAFDKGNAQQQWDARNRLDAYTSSSKRWAFLVAFVMSLLVALMGVRAIEMLVQQDAVASIPTSQQSLFVWVDVWVTALLLTGGAEGIHKVVNAFTTFIDGTKQKMTDQRNPSGPRFTERTEVTTVSTTLDAQSST